MIEIVNFGATSEQERGNPDGERMYSIFINAHALGKRRKVGEFIHRRGDGLAECLRRAADSIDSAD